MPINVGATFAFDAREPLIDLAQQAIGRRSANVLFTGVRDRRAAKFAGGAATNSRIEFPTIHSSLALPGLTPMSFVCRWLATTTTDFKLFSVYRNGGGVTLNYNMFFGALNSAPTFVFSRTSTTQWIRLSATTITVAEHVIVGTYDGSQMASGGSMKLWYDGQVPSTVTQDGVGTMHAGITSLAVLVGEQSGGTSNGCSSAHIYTVRLWNRMLQPEEALLLSRDPHYGIRSRQRQVDFAYASGGTTEYRDALGITYSFGAALGGAAVTLYADGIAIGEAQLIGNGSAAVDRDTLAISESNVVGSGSGQAAAQMGLIQDITMAFPAIKPRTPMPRLQLNATAYSNLGTTGTAKDGRYRQTYRWNCTENDWLALDLGTDSNRTTLAVALSAEDQGFGDIEGAGLANFVIAVSSNSTNGSDGDWTAVHTVSSHPYRFWSGSVNITGYRWIRFTAGAGISYIDEFEVWNATNGFDCILIAGDSITAGGTKRGDQTGVGVQPSVQTWIDRYHGQYPLQAGFGIVGQAAANLDGRIDAWMAACTNCSIVCVAIGTNDTQQGLAHLSAFLTSLTSILDKIVAAGKTPLVARIPWTSSTSYGGGSDVENCTIKQYNDAIDDLIVSRGMLPGPDMYWNSYNERAIWYGADVVHPLVAGYRRWNELWAQALAPLYAEMGEAVSMAVARDGIAYSDSSAKADGSANGAVTAEGLAASGSVLLGDGSSAVSATATGIAATESILVGFGSAAAGSAGLGLSGSYGAALGGATVAIYATGLAAGGAQAVGYGSVVVGRTGLSLVESAVMGHAISGAFKFCTGIAHSPSFALGQGSAVARASGVGFSDSFAIAGGLAAVAKSGEAVTDSFAVAFFGRTVLVTYAIPFSSRDIVSPRTTTDYVEARYTKKL